MKKTLSKLREKRLIHRWFGWMVIALSLIGIFGSFNSNGWYVNLNVYNLALLLLGILSVMDSRKD